MRRATKRRSDGATKGREQRPSFVLKVLCFIAPVLAISPSLCRFIPVFPPFVTSSLRRFVAFFTILLAHATASADSIRLLEEAVVAGDQVVLHQVAALDGPASEAFGDLVVGALRAKQSRTTITLGALRARLTDRGANWGRLSLRGFSRCRVVRVEPVISTPAPAATSEPGLAVANPTATVDANAPQSLQGHAIAFLASFARAPQRELRIQFAERDKEILAAGVWSDRVAFEPLSRSALGRVPLIVRRFRGGRLAETHRITAQVERRVHAVVARRGIGQRAVIEPPDVELKHVYVRRARPEPCTRLEEVVGHMAVSVLRSGTIVCRDHVRPLRLVRRGDTVTVHCAVGGLLIKTFGRAMADGSDGQFIQVRNEHPGSKQSYRARVSGPRHVTLDLNSDPLSGPVPSEEGAPARPEAS